MKNRNSILTIFLILVVITLSCNNRQSNNAKEQKFNDIVNDTTKTYVSYKNAVYCIPSPQLVNLYIKRFGIYPNFTAVNPISNIDKYSTSAKKALNLGIYGVDLGYMNLFNVSENTNAYVAAIGNLSHDIGLNVIFTNNVYNTIINLKNNPDSLAKYLTLLFSDADTYFNNNSQQQTSDLVIAGGWIESFYLLNFTYNQYKIDNIANYILQQKFIVENLIKKLAPFYENSPEIHELIDNLVDIAYDFDMLDVKIKYTLPLYKISNGIICFNNSNKIVNSDQCLKVIAKKIFTLREKIIS